MLMKPWLQFFDAVYLINLPLRTARFINAAIHLQQHEIPFKRISAVADFDGTTNQTGLIRTMKTLFSYAVGHNQQRILVFEDDVQFVKSPGLHMPDVIRQLDGREWDMLSLGPNTHQPFEYFESENLLKMEKCRGLHAMAYNITGMNFLLNNLQYRAGAHLDVLFEEQVQPRGCSYCTYPLICTQSSGFSDIDNKETDQSYIQDRFYQHTKHLIA